LNGLLDPGETDIDCGGPICEACLPGERCLNNSDCFTHCVGSSLTEPKDTTDYTFEPPPEGILCPSFQTVSECDQYSGCIWLEEFTRCKKTGLLPGTGTCTSQQKKESCINFLLCEWSAKGEVCVDKKDPLEYGICYGTVFNGNYFEEENEWYSEILNNLIDFWHTYPYYSYGIIATLGLSILCCFYSCASNFFRRRRYRKSIKKRRSQIQRSPRASSRSPLVVYQDTNFPSYSTSTNTSVSTDSGGTRYHVTQVFTAPTAQAAQTSGMTSSFSVPVTNGSKVDQSKVNNYNTVTNTTSTARIESENHVVEVVPVSEPQTEVRQNVKVSNNVNGSSNQHNPAPENNSSPQGGRKLTHF